MSFEDCVNDAMDEGSVGKEFGKAAQERWRKLRDASEAQGSPRHVAEQLAAARVKQELHAEAAAKKHAKLATLADAQRAVEEVASTATPRLIQKMTQTDFQARAIERAAMGKMGEFLASVRTNVVGRSRDPILVGDVVRGVFGETTKGPEAKTFAKGVTDTLEWLRLMANEAGASIGRLDGFFPVVHNRRQIDRAGFDAWFTEIDPKIDWARVTDGGGNMSLDARTNYMREVYRNIIFGKETREPSFGRKPGQAVHRRLSAQRVLHWKTADDWMNYNKKFGSGDPLQSLHDHVRTMAKDIAMMRNFGPTPALGLDYRAQLWAQKAADANDRKLTDKVARQGNIAARMMRVLNGPGVPQTQWGEWRASFFATTRQIMSGAQLERAVLMAPPDLASTATAASMIGMNPVTPLGQFVGALPSLSKDELLQMQWVSETWADPGATQARFSSEVGATNWAQQFNNTSMRLGGLAGWSDRLRAIDYQAFSAHLASVSNRGWADLHPGLRGLMEEHGMTAADWDVVRGDMDGMFTAENGARFLAPVFWHSNTKLDGSKANDIFLKLQGTAERFMEMGQPSRSLVADAFLDPTAYGLTPGDPLYELGRSLGMYKRFVFSLTTNMAAQWRLRPTVMSKASYVAMHVAMSAALAGAAIQVKEVLAGREPRPMDGGFLFNAMVAGGGLALIGDVLMFGENPNGRGLVDWLAGPMVSVGNEAGNLTLGNAYTAISQWLAGEEIDTNFIPEMRRFADRNLIPEPFWVGPAVDRLLLDQFQILFDPDSRTALDQAARRQERTYGNGYWWAPGRTNP